MRDSQKIALTVVITLVLSVILIIMIDNQSKKSKEKAEQKRLIELQYKKESLELVDQIKKHTKRNTILENINGLLSSDIKTEPYGILGQKVFLVLENKSDYNFQKVEYLLEHLDKDNVIIFRENIQFDLVKRNDILRKEITLYKKVTSYKWNYAIIECNELEINYINNDLILN
ncbi:MAG: hypothetical protein GX102_09860 [Porphyromonadaceae bacterium]|nr:hypothetical protein [Porphyromonadaceae bacterium]